MYTQMQDHEGTRVLGLYPHEHKRICHLQGLLQGEHRKILCMLRRLLVSIYVGLKRDGMNKGREGKKCMRVHSRLKVKYSVR